MTENNESKKTIVFQEKLICPHCKGKIIVVKERKLLNAPVKPEYGEVVIVKKDTQKTLEADNFGKTK